MSVINGLLQSARETLEAPDHSTLTFVVIGNQSCDLDSVSTAIALAHYISIKSQSNRVIPLLNCHREDLPLRQDVTWLLQHLGIDHTQFVHYPEQFDPAGFTDLQVTLVDHNVPDEKLRPHVKEILDHHEDAEAIQCTRVIESVGSCCSLVAERLTDDQDYEMTREVAWLLLAAILADTGNLMVEGRTTDKDKSMASRLKDLVDISTDELYNKICTARYNISDLTTLQLLRADFKDSEVCSYRIGFSTVRSLMTKLATERSQVDQDVALFCDQKDLQLLVVLCIQMKPLQKQIALYQPHHVSQDLVDSVAATLEASTDLQVERVGEGMFDGIVFEQGNVTVTRKQILPIVTRCLQQGELDDSLETGVVTPEPIVTVSEEVKVETVQSEGKNNEGKSEAKNDKEVEDSQSPKGSHLQLDSISARLGESMDSFTLAQDSDQGGHSPTSSRTSSTYNIGLDRLDEEARPPPPLEPIVDIVSPLDSNPPPVLPDEPSIPAIPEYTSDEEIKETRDFRTIMIDGQERRINLKFIEKYRPIIQHGGYVGSEQTAVIVVNACYLPSKQLLNYPQIISQLFFYVLSVVDKLVVDDYVLVYMHSGAPRNSMPGIQWFHKFYRMIDRRLRKNLKHLYIVHPTFWVKTMLRLARPFISRKFYRKVHHVPSLKQLSLHLTVDDLFIPNAVRSADQILNPEDYKAPPTV